jgi:glycosyltransferase involved in cell wall biosynthesis
VSRECLDEARVAFGVPAERLRLIPNGRDPAVYRPGTRFGAAGRPRVVFVGHLTAGKRPERFVEVVRGVRARGLAIEASLVGDGPLLPTLRRLGTVAGIEVTGRRDDVASILGQADILVFPSMAEGEGMPGVLIEAGLCGVAVVATRVPGASTVVEDGVTGFVVAIEDLEALVDRVSRLVADARLRAEMSAAAIRRCRAQFTLDASAARWDELLQSLIGTPR